MWGLSELADSVAEVVKGLAENKAKIEAFVQTESNSRREFQTRIDQKLDRLEDTQKNEIARLEERQEKRLDRIEERLGQRISQLEERLDAAMLRMERDAGARASQFEAIKLELGRTRMDLPNGVAVVRAPPPAE